MTDENTLKVHLILGEIIILNHDTSLTTYMDATEQVNRINGWYDGPERNLSDDGALIASEGIEMFEEARNGHGPNEVYFTHDKKCPFKPGQVATRNTMEDYEEVTCCVLKPEGFPTELADVLIRAFDTARRRGIDIDFEIRRKLQYNLTRGYRHGGKSV